MRRAALGEGAQEEHAAVDFLDADVAVGDSGKEVSELVEFVVVGREQDQRLEGVVVKVLGD